MTTNNNHSTELLAESLKDFFVTQTVIAKDEVPIARLIEILKLAKTNGELCVRFNKGGIRQIELKQWTIPSDKQAARIREILDME